MGSSPVSIGFLPFGIYRIYAEKLALKMPKSLDKSRLFAWASFLVPSYGAGSGGRTHTVLLPPDFESGASANSTIPAHNAVLYYTIAIVPFQVKFSPARCPPQPQGSMNQGGLDGIDEKAGFPVSKILQF